MILPLTASAFTVYYFWKYVEGWLFIRMMLQCKDFIKFVFIRKIMICIGVFLSIYSILQYMGWLGTEVQLTDTVDVHYVEGTILGPYNSTYFALGQMSPLCFLFSCSKVNDETKQLHKVLYALLSIFISFPALFCGSRTALVLIVSSFVFYYWVIRKMKDLAVLATFGAILILFFSISKGLDFGSFLGENNRTLERAEFLSDNKEQSVKGRSLYFLLAFDIDRYDYSSLVPFVGAGFYVAPMEGRYRIGYGYHNAYLFSFEQLGCMGFLLFICLYYRTIIRSFRYRRYNPFAALVFAYVLGLVIVGPAGNTFWRGNATGNINTLLVFLFSIGTVNLSNTTKQYNYVS